MNTVRFLKVVDFLRENLENGKLDFWGDKNVQAFNSRNVIGDTMENIYDEDDIQIDVCYGYCYIEIFGLSDEEFEELEKMGLTY